MRKINVTTTIEVPDKATNEEVYDLFREILRETTEYGDLTSFLFINPDTNEQIEEEKEE